MTCIDPDTSIQTNRTARIKVMILEGKLREQDLRSTKSILTEFHMKCWPHQMFPKRPTWWSLTHILMLFCGAWVRVQTAAKSDLLFQTLFSASVQMTLAWMELLSPNTLVSQRGSSSMLSSVASVCPLMWRHCQANKHRRVWSCSHWDTPVQMPPEYVVCDCSD